MQDTTEGKADRNKSKLLLNEAKELRETADKLIKESEAKAGRWANAR
jgi:hypothetical protein